MSGICSAHQGPCPYDCHINGERKRLLELRDFVENDLIPLVEMDDEANDPSKDLYVVVHQTKELLDATQAGGDDHG